MMRSAALTQVKQRDQWVALHHCPVLKEEKEETVILKKEASVQRQSQRGREFSLTRITNARIFITVICFAKNKGKKEREGKKSDSRNSVLRGNRKATKQMGSCEPGNCV